MKEFLPHILVLGLIKESSIGMGRSLLSSCLRGERDDRLVKLKLNRLVHYGSLPLYDTKDIFELLDLMQGKGMIELKGLPSNKFIKVLGITAKGEEELKNPSQKLKPNNNFEGHYSSIEKVSEEDRKLFSGLGDILSGLSDEQKKAVICGSRSILCIAGAGSGKTKVLTKRAWYLAAIKSVDPSKILAITFTRKARQEMGERLSSLMPGNNMQIETFNSFCENILKEKEEIIYGQKYTVIDYPSKVKLVMKSLQELNIDVDYLLNNYYSDRKLQSHDRKLLFLGFVNDLFSLMDYHRNNNMSDEKIKQSLIEYPNIRAILSKIKEHKENNCLRDYTDQMTHVIDFFRNNPGHIPVFEHILVDEYQDINSLQFELLELLNPKNLFCVGDPRQSIYGWRGSRIEYILDFEKNYEHPSILQLSANYRSSRNIVDLCNKIISPLKLPSLVSSSEPGEEIKFIKHDSEDSENLFVVQSILGSDFRRDEIFVLARTNKQLDNISSVMDSYGVKYLKRTIENTKQSRTPEEDEVTLSTVHAIKGLEAELVYIIGANAKNHPCKASEHPVLEMAKADDAYDKLGEELRLLYVALSRAKKKLVINYTGSISPYFEEPEKKHISFAKEKQKYKSNNSGMLYEELKSFRNEESSRLGIAAYQVFNDRTLDELCSLLPNTLEDLSEITGFGPYKVRKWGKKIMQIIKDYG